MRRKKLLSSLLTLCMVIPMFNSVQAADEGYDYRIEAEDSYKATNWRGSPLIASRASSSGGKHLALYYSMSGVDEYYVEYELEVDKDGVYDLDMGATPVDESWTSPIYVSVNGGEAQPISGVMFQQVPPEYQLEYYHAGAVYLQEGTNTIRFIIKEPKRDDNSTAVCFLDWFGLKLSSYSIREITSDAPFQAFQQGEELKFTMVGVTNAVEDTEVAYDVIDYSGKYVFADKTVIKKGDLTTDFVIPPMKNGAYQIVANCKGKTTVQQFLVVTNLKDRKKLEDSPFALDAIQYGVMLNLGGKLGADFCDLIELTGVTWVRDRVYFDPYSTKTGNKWEFKMPYAATTGQLLNDKGIKVSMSHNLFPKSLYGDDPYADYLTVKLFDVYNYAKQLAEKYDGTVNCWELLNEVDIGGGGMFNREPADQYSSMLKAMALGIMDSETEEEVYISLMGLASKPDHESQYIQLLYDNDIFDYTDINNYHFHRGANEPYESYYENNGTWITTEHLNLQKEHGYRISNWNGETGMSFRVPGNVRDFDSEEQIVQAKYLVTSYVEEFAKGADKRFYFCGGNYQEGAAAYGMTSSSKTSPSAYASWGSLAAMTHVLGEGIYAGKIKGLPEGVNAFAFTDGDETAIIYYSTSTEYKKYDFDLNLGTKSAVHYDFFANPDKLYSNNGVYKLTAGDCPEYIKIKGAITTDIFTDDYVDEYVPLGETQKSVDDGKRVLLVQKFSDRARSNNPRGNGYNLSEDSNGVDIEVYNFNDYTVRGKIVAKSASGWDIECETPEVEIAPMTMQTVHFEIIPDGFKALKDKITFYGELDCGNTSESVVVANSKKLVDAQPNIINGETGISLMLENPTHNVKTISSAKLTVNGNETEYKESVTIEAKASKEIRIPAYFALDAKNLAISAHITFTDGTECTYNGETAFATAANKIDLNAVPSFVLPDDGTVQSQYNYGKEDFYAQCYLAADEENFYFTAVVQDNEHCAPAEGTGIWSNDSIQFALAGGLPAAGLPYYELGMGLTDSGKTTVFCWNDPDKGGWSGELEGADCTITRDEATYTTTYKLTLPWSLVPRISFEDGFSAFSMLINENDGNGREGYIEWGSGIGSSKKPEEFRTILFTR